MLSNVFMAAVLAVPAMASLKDLAGCDPLRKDMNCPPDPAFASNASFDFTTASWNQGLEDFWDIDNDTVHDKRRLDFNTDGKGVAMGMWQAGEAPTLTSRKYLLFGKVSATVQAARGPGLITALVMKSDSGDEIDWELLGAYEKQAASNYFYDGKALFNTYNDTYGLDTSSFDSFHTYTVVWTDKILAFSIDGTTRKTWHVGEIPPGSWPQTPMHVKVGVWSESKDSDRGEVMWAGGEPDWERGPFKAYVKSIEIEDCVGWCAETEGGVAYQYDERTWGWQNVRIQGCKKREGPALIPPTGTTGQPGGGSPSRTGDEAPPTGSVNAGDAGEDDGAIVLRLSSPLAAIVCLCWLLVL
ncbi:putative glycosidase crf1 [Tolypocladium ophioglossoides CBS 100239]|uniref:Putative glycosidase crf1 n=1 Tax=Tolypocladium ophioglossoides (strain CBS 100239) TaxID=1163406 RepID=A0A0L0N6B5_TOLOC|nr:putative glycosidase crf1 [Tolypocladium ophioglossoides CBS 100239]